MADEPNDEFDDEFMDKWMDEHPDPLGRDGIEPPIEIYFGY